MAALLVVVDGDVGDNDRATHLQADLLGLPLHRDGKDRMMVDVEATFLPSDVTVEIEVGEHLDQPLRMIHSAELGWCFDHVCLRGEAQAPIYIRCAPRCSAHEVDYDGAELITLHGSILCNGCQIHGYVRASVWEGV